MSAPRSRSARPSTYPWVSSKVAPIASSPLRCMSIGREPKSSPPGKRDLGVAESAEQRAEHVDRGPDPLDELVGRDRGDRTVVVQGRARRRRHTSPPHRTPIAPSSSHMMPTSSMPGTLVSRYSPSARIVAAISLSTEFLAPGTRTEPESGPLRRATIRDMAPPILAPPSARTRHSSVLWPARPVRARRPAGSLTRRGHRPSALGAHRSGSAGSGADGPRRPRPRTGRSRPAPSTRPRARSASIAAPSPTDPTAASTR